MALRTLHVPVLLVIIVTIFFEKTNADEGDDCAMKAREKCLGNSYGVDLTSLVITGDPWAMVQDSYDLCDTNPATQGHYVYVVKCYREEIKKCPNKGAFITKDPGNWYYNTCYDFPDTRCLRRAYEDTVSKCGVDSAKEAALRGKTTFTSAACKEHYKVTQCLIRLARECDLQWTFNYTRNDAMLEDCLDKFD